MQVLFPRDRSHNLQIPTRTSSFKDDNFLIHMLYRHNFYLCIFSMTLFYSVLFYTSERIVSYNIKA